MIIQCL